MFVYEVVWVWSVVHLVRVVSMYVGAGIVCVNMFCDLCRYALSVPCTCVVYVMDVLWMPCMRMPCLLVVMCGVCVVYVLTLLCMCCARCVCVEFVISVLRVLCDVLSSLCMC